MLRRLVSVVCEMRYGRKHGVYFVFVLRESQMEDLTFGNTRSCTMTHGWLPVVPRQQIVSRRHQPVIATWHTILPCLRRHGCHTVYDQPHSICAYMSITGVRSLSSAPKLAATHRHNLLSSVKFWREYFFANRVNQNTFHSELEKDKSRIKTHECDEVQPVQSRRDAHLAEHRLDPPDFNGRPLFEGCDLFVIRIDSHSVPEQHKVNTS